MFILGPNINDISQQINECVHKENKYEKTSQIKFH